MFAYKDGAEPFFYPGGRVGCLLIHGFTGSPYMHRWVGQALNKQGYTVFAPRLAGHGMHFTHLRHVRWPEWVADALDGYHVLKAHCDEIVIIGHSMGGMVAIMLATEVQTPALVVMACPITLSAIWRVHLLRPVVRFLNFGDPTGFEARLKVAQSARGEPPRGRVTYNRTALAGIVEVNRLAQAARARLPQINTPLLLVYAQQDRTAKLHHADIIQAEVNSATVEKIILTQGAHNVMADEDHPRVIDGLTAFLTRQAPPAIG
ncbi:MAG: alpha/beta hydrolase [Anaerolineales bacterium]